VSSQEESDEPTAEKFADAVDRLLAGARLMLTPRPYASIEGAASILRDSHSLTALLCHQDAPARVDDGIEVLRRRRGLDRVPRVAEDRKTTIPDQSDPVAAITTAVEHIIRAAHTFDLLNGRDTSILTIVDAARVIDESGRDDDSFQMAMDVAEEFRRRGGVTRLFGSGP
jgi:hypothetical protein